MEWQFERVAGPFNFTEGPVWDGRHVFFTDIPSSRTLRFDPQSGECVVHIPQTYEGNGQTLDHAGRLVQVQHKGRAAVRYEPDGTVTTLASHFQGKRLNSPNDVVVDKLGRIWFTDPRYGDFRDDMELDHESVYRLDPQPDGSYAIHRVTYDTTSPNGLIVTPDMRTLYVAQSKYGDGEMRELRAYPINDDGSVSDHRVLHNFYPHRSMRLDADGNVVANSRLTQSGPGL
ncbi:MAG: SMP-30/gluconolactonase/LRE family protein [Caldilineaceae bacterium]